jgi:hypothetical protein
MRPSSSKDSGYISQLWLANPPTTDASVYQPTVLIECKLNFRSLRASYHHSEERSYSAWYPEGEIPVDWDRPAIKLPPTTKFINVAPVDLPYKQGNFYFTTERLMEMEEDLLSRLLRTEKLCLLYNPIFKIYSTPNEQRDDFLSRVSETALMEMEPELRELMRRFELKLEQVRESEERKGRKEPLPEPDLLKLIEKRSELITSKSRLTSMFLNTAKTALRSNRSTDVATMPMDMPNRELHETLYHIEQEACDAVNSLCEEFLERSQQCDKFEIGLQHQNVQVLRRAILWLAV